MNAAAPTCLVSLLIPHPSRTSVLVPDPGPSTLPTIRLDTVEPTLTQILASVEAVITGLGPVLRSVITTQTCSEGTSDASMLVEFDPHSADAPVGWR